MATDNRHRPGKPFVCPTCGAYAGYSSYRSVIVRDEGEPKRIGTRRQITPVIVYPVRCTRCGRRWLSKHRVARQLHGGH